MLSNKKIKNQKIDSDKYLYLILKVYQEEATIEDSILRLRKLVNNSPNIKIIIVGTIKERKADHKNHTLTLARKLTKNDKNFKVIECDVIGSHAHQNNYAIKSIKTKKEKSWILTLDIDSDITKQGLIQLIKLINRNKLIIQQNTVFLSNFKKLNILQQGNAIFQSRWTLAKERKRLILNTLLKGWYVYHVVGHGLCINLDKLNEYDNFNEEVLIEDLALGFYLSAANERIVMLPTLEIGDTPNAFYEGFKQKITWSYGPMSYPLYYNNFKTRFPDKFKENKLRTIVLMLIGFYSYFSWLFLSAFLFIMIYLALNNNILASYILWRHLKARQAYIRRKKHEENPKTS
jgi:hypothetical protein